MNPVDAASLNVTQRLKNGASSPVSRAEAVRPAASEGGRTGAAVTTGLKKTASAGAEAPIDVDRVAEIRKAVEEGRYPLVPTRIGDAMIAAGYLLRTKS
ncbi:negative regulator of flagellin synthesis FlgM [Altererythrobacter atlanticus]|uniref:Anti-sigma-28 factor FlgM C-terminal domain-containing protein n=1 Tax=Croceibacterium atlanticum TaxID=1267766 RepID=A0A0F7KV08_9SPHN|nr:flagellar biosynthesis anti-sigma factor FlgM [Croceibacterium atlanticum]AKH44188.1 hypothetical protein WYH_03169 [Croceibacterium atlanticum]MBB5732499.1 negative regulator of flagellin synthesis FlgM [Croceibacterium atlanticum]